MRHASIAIALGLLVVTTGCDRRNRFAPPDSAVASPPPAPARAVFLSVSSLAPDSGGTIVVAATMSVDNSLSLGSFRARLVFDSSRIAFLEEVTTPGMMRVVNPQSGEIVVVGASAGPATDGRLFTLRFRVVDPAGVGSLALRIDELNDAGFTDQLSTVTNSARLVLDTTLVKWKAAPR
jgi:hypothetical protein